MADQSVRVENMPDSGSRENVALKLWADLSYSLPEEGDWKARINRSLDLYATCLQAATQGRRTRFE
jgi:hypothetical protein